MRRHNLVSDQIYHAFNRGVEKRTIFSNEQDYGRFVADLEIFNDENPTPYRMDCGTMLRDRRRERKPLVDILAFCLMPTHFHLVLRQKSDNGIAKFMQKLGDGYVRFFNEKYERVGPLFQGRFKSVLIEEDAHFNHIPHYVHANPLDLVLPHWREKKLNVKEVNQAIKFLESYPWSSNLDYSGKNNFPQVTNRDVFNELFGVTENYIKSFKEFLKNLTSSDSGSGNFTLRAFILLLPLINLLDIIGDFIFS